MKKIHSILQRSLIVAVSLAGLASCVRPDIEGCVDPRGNVRVTVHLSDAPGVRGDEQTGIGTVHLYVFDSADTFIARAEGGAHTGGDYEFFLTLPGGDHRFVVWTNLGDTYRTAPALTAADLGHRTLDELKVYFDHPADQAVDGPIPDLWYGHTPQAVDESRNNHVPVVLSPNTYTVNVKVTGIPLQLDPYAFTITDNHSHYTFDNDIVAGQPDFRYVRTAYFLNGELNVSFKVLRLTADRDPAFTFTHVSDGDTHFSQGLVSVIRGAYENAGQTLDFDRTHTFDLVLHYDSNMDVTVSVNGWDYKNEPGDLE